MSEIILVYLFMAALVIVGGIVVCVTAKRMEGTGGEAKKIAKYEGRDRHGN